MKISLYKIFKGIKFEYAWRIALFYILRKLLNLGQFKVYFSQLGEDIILLNILEGRSRGFYIDVGCNEPIKYSNTFYFYLRGWSGINIDANEALIRKFKQVRTRDISICSAVSDVEFESKYYISNQNPEVNTTDYSTYLKWKDTWKYDEEKTIYMQRLDKILDRYINPEQEIDFMSIDVEGYDFKVLKSIDLYRYRPNIIVIEIHDMNFDALSDNEIFKYLLANEYTFIGYVAINAYFKSSKSK